MQCTTVKPCAGGNVIDLRRQKLTLTISPSVLKLLAEAMTEEKETNRSELVEYLMQCWIYSRKGKCDPKCPYFDEEKIDAKKT